MTIMTTIVVAAVVEAETTKPMAWNVFRFGCLTEDNGGVQRHLSDQRAYCPSMLERRALMRKFLLPLAGVAATVALSAPASAQWAQPQGYAYGYNNLGQARALHARINRIQRDIRNLAQRRMITPTEFRSRSADARNIEQRLRHEITDRGQRRLTQREAADINRRIQRLEMRIARDIRDGRNYGNLWR